MSEAANPEITSEERAKDIQKKFQLFIEEGIHKLPKNETIASLSYTEKDEKEPKTIEFKYVGYEQKTEKLKCYPNISIEVSGKKHTWKADWAISLAKETGMLVFGFKQLGAGWNFLEIDDPNSEVTLKDPSEKIKELPRVKAVDENFVRFWFLQGAVGSSKHEDTPDITRKHIICKGSAYEESWKRLKLNESIWKFSIDEFPTLPEYDAEQCAFQENEVLAVEWARFFIVLLVWRFILTQLSVEKHKTKTGEEDESFKKFSGNIKFISPPKEFVKKLFGALPLTAEYKLKRPVDVDLQAIYSKVKDAGLEIPWHVVSSVSAALNAGKHIIFTGPPGCGKTHLAKLISKQVSKISPIMATASQAWSTDEIIGRYLPKVDGNGLEFKEGFFLRALDKGKWLIIDEINRCDIDNCFGELFTVLAGQSVLLPFEKCSDDSDATKTVPIRIEVGGDGEDGESADDYFPYRCPDSFRLLATMNDADIAGLNQLSYALRRRFAIIRVDAPSDEAKKDIFKGKIKTVFEDLDLEKRVYLITRSRGDKHNGDSLKDKLGDLVNLLFAVDESIVEYDDLVDQGVVGIAPVLDIIRFVGEGLRSPDTKSRKVAYPEGDSKTKNKDATIHLLKSFLAMGLVLNVFPQLDAVAGDDDRFVKAIKRIMVPFKDTDTFFRIEKNGSSLKLVGTTTIREHLTQELERQYSRDRGVIGLIRKTTGSDD